MGWANCGDDSAGRPIGYAHKATCDHPGCNAPIDRGLSYACGGMHGTGSLGGDRNIDWDSMSVACEGYFCGKHLLFSNLEHEDGTELYAPCLCPACTAELERLYRTDPDWREIWPTKAPPLPAQGMSAEGENSRSEVEGEARQPGSPTGECATPISTKGAGGGQ